jgi:dipeptidyl-peptidase-4
MKKIVLFSIVFVFIINLQAQNKKLTLKDAIYANHEVLPKRISQLQFKGNTGFLAYVEDNILKERHQISPEKKRPLLTLEELQQALTEANFDSIRRFPSLRFLDDNSFRFQFQNTLFSYNLKTSKLNKLNSYNEKAQNISICNKNNAIAYTLDNNLYLAINGKEIAVTEDQNPDIINGQQAHRNEFGISGGIFWSPEGNKVAFYHKDQTMVSDYPLVDFTSRVAKLDNIKYPMIGMTSEEVQLGIYDLQSQKTVFLKTGTPKDHYLTAVSWDPHEQYVYIAILNRDQNHLQLKKYDAQTGDELAVLLEEKDDKYVEPEHPLYFLNKHTDQFIWFSERDRWDHLYLYDTKGNMIKQLTKGNWAVTEFLGIDARDQFAYFMATKESPLQSHLYKVSIQSGKISKLTDEHGTHYVRLNENKTYFIDIYSNTEKAKVYQTRTTKGKFAQLLLEDINPLANYALGEMKMLSLKADDGADLYARLIKPANFDPDKKYPAIVYVYGGPHAQLVTDSWLGGAGLFLNFLAQQGYVIFTLDNHGSANRGLDFEQKIFRQCGVQEVKDQMTGIEYLKTLDFVDPERIGVDGWSYGGFMTIRLKLEHPEIFKVAVAGGPVIDWKWYEVMYGERYMDTPETNPEGFETSSLLNKVDQLTDYLLIIHGVQDPTVVCQHSQMFLREAIKKGKQLDYFTYPTHQHNVRGLDREHLYRKIYRYFKEKL